MRTLASHYLCALRGRDPLTPSVGWVGVTQPKGKRREHSVSCLRDPLGIKIVLSVSCSMVGILVQLSFERIALAVGHRCLVSPTRGV